jgi:hypothetical protein
MRSLPTRINKRSDFILRASSWVHCSSKLLRSHLTLLVKDMPKVVVDCKRKRARTKSINNNSTYSVDNLQYQLFPLWFILFYMKEIEPVLTYKS